MTLLQRDESANDWIRQKMEMVLFILRETLPFTKLLGPSEAL